MLSTCAQLLWPTYPRPVLSGPLSFKTLDDLSNCAAAQFQGVATICLLRSSESSLACGAMLELSVTSMREYESCTTNMNTPAPYTHMGHVTLMSHLKFLSVLSHEEIYLNICRNLRGVLTFVIQSIYLSIYLQGA